MGMAVILVMWPGHLNKLSFPHPKEAPREILLQILTQFFQRRCLKMLTTRTQTYERTTEAYLSYELTNEPSVQVS